MALIQFLIRIQEFQQGLYMMTITFDMGISWTANIYRKNPKAEPNTRTNMYLNICLSIPNTCTLFQYTMMLTMTKAIMDLW